MPALGANPYHLVPVRFNSRCMSLSFISRLRAEWAPSIPRELLAGAVATFALIPEVIAFSFVAGVDPSVGLFASFVISIVIAFFGGRPAMVSAGSVDALNCNDRFNLSKMVFA